MLLQINKPSFNWWYIVACIALSLFIFSLCTVEYFKVTKHLVWTKNCQNQTNQRFPGEQTVRWDESDNHFLQNPLWWNPLIKSTYFLLLVHACTSCTWFQVIDNKDGCKTGWCVIHQALHLNWAWIEAANRMLNYNSNLDGSRSGSIMSIQSNSKKIHILWVYCILQNRLKNWYRIYSEFSLWNH